MEQSIFYVDIENMQDVAKEAVTEAIKHDSDGKVSSAWQQDHQTPVFFLSHFQLNFAWAFLIHF